MPETLVRDVSPSEYFHEEITRAMRRQRVSTSAFTECYLVSLLTACLRADALPAAEPGFSETPLALLYARALESAGAERTRRLRRLGDAALFISGFFADSLDAGAVGHRYYRTLGERAYDHLSQREAKTHGPGVFAELAGRFGELADVIAEVSDESRSASPTSVVRLYERWLETGSRRAAAQLAQRGITPMLPVNERAQ